MHTLLQSDTIMSRPAYVWGNNTSTLLFMIHFVCKYNALMMVDVAWYYMYVKHISSRIQINHILFTIMQQTLSITVQSTHIPIIHLSPSLCRALCLKSSTINIIASLPSCFIHQLSSHMKMNAMLVITEKLNFILIFHIAFYLWTQKWSLFLWEDVSSILQK